MAWTKEVSELYMKKGDLITQLELLNNQLMEVNKQIMGELNKPAKPLENV